jgi:hypothetical protein
VICLRSRQIGRCGVRLLHPLVLRGPRNGSRLALDRREPIAPAGLLRLAARGPRAAGAGALPTPAAAAETVRDDVPDRDAAAAAGCTGHVSAEEEPEQPDYPRDHPAFQRFFKPRGVLDCTASDLDDDKVDERFGRIGKQTIRDSGPLTRERLRTIEDDLLAHSVDFICRALGAGKPLLLWHNTTRMHVWTRLSDRWRDKTGFGVYADATRRELLTQRLRTARRHRHVWEWTSDYHTTPCQTEHSCGIPNNPRVLTPDDSFAPAAEPGSNIPRRVIKGGSHLCAPNYCPRYRPAARQPQMIETGTGHSASGAFFDTKPHDPTASASWSNLRPVVHSSGRLRAIRGLSDYEGEVTPRPYQPPKIAARRF